MARKDAEKLCLQVMDEIDPSGKNTARWKKKFKEMSDDDFKAYVESLEQGRDYLSIVSPNFTDSKVTTKNNFRVAKKYGINLFCRIWVEDPVTKIKYLSNEVYPIFYLPVRRQIQMAKTKFSYAHENSKTDALTGQPVGVSEAGGISYPELLVLYSRGLEDSISELIWSRGGNKGAFKMMNKIIKDTGSCTLAELQKYSTGVKSTQVLHTYFNAIHIQNTI